MKIKEIIERPFVPPLFVFLVASVLRLAFVMFYRDFPLLRFPILDAGYNAEWAQHIAAGHLWGEQVFFRAPLYPYFLAMVFFLSGKGFLAARVLQALIGAGGAVVCYYVGLEFFKEKKIAFAGALTAAFTWTSIYFDVEFLSVVLEAPLFLLFVLFVSRAKTGNPGGRSGRPVHFLLAGVCLGLGAITRPNVLAFAAVIWIIFFFGRPRPSWKISLLGLGVTYLTAAAFVLPVAAQNYVAGRDFVPIASCGGLNLYMGNNPEADGIAPTLPGTPGDWHSIYYNAGKKAEEEAGRPLKPSEVDRFYVNKVLDFYREDTGSALKLLMKKAYVYTNAFEFGNCYNLNYLKSKTAVLRYNPVSLYIILPFAFLAMAVYARRRPGHRGSRPGNRVSRPDLLALYLYVVTYSATVVLFYVNDKYRMPVVPALSLFAAAGVFWLLEKARSKEYKKLVIGATAVVAFAVYCWVPPLGTNTDPNDIQARLTLGRLHRELGEYEAAEREILSAYELSPDDGRVLEYLAVLYFATGRKDEAAPLFEKTLTYDPGNYAALTDLGIYYAEKGEYETSYSYFGRAEKAVPDDPRAYYLYGEALRAGGRPEKAKGQFYKVLEIDPTHAGALASIGRIALDLGEMAEAERSFSELIKLRPRDAGALAAMGELKYKTGDFRASGWFFKHAAVVLEDDGKNPGDVYYNLACALALQGENDEALVYLKKAITTDGHRYRDYARADPDLVSLHELEEFEMLTEAR